MVSNGGFNVPQHFPAAFADGGAQGRCGFRFAPVRQGVKVSGSEAPRVVQAAPGAQHVFQAGRSRFAEGSSRAVFIVPLPGETVNDTENLLAMFFPAGVRQTDGQGLQLAVQPQGGGRAIRRLQGGGHSRSVIPGEPP